MADITEANLSDRVLQHLGILAAGATAASADTTLVEEEIQATWSRLRKFGLAPFALSAIPDWAQQQLCDLVAYECAPKYGITGQRFLELAERARVAEFDLNRQLSGFKHKRRTHAEYF